MTFVYVVFDRPGCEYYSILAETLHVSIEKNCPFANIIRIETDPPGLVPGKPRGHVDNTEKLSTWNDQVQKIKDDIILIDCDIVLNRDITQAFTGDFAVGIMKRSRRNPNPYNGGIVFVRNCEKAKRFVNEWNKNNQLFFNNNAAYNKYRSKTLGINQAALLATLDQDSDTKIQYFSCRIWDACPEDWLYVDSKTYAIHIMGNLRAAALRNINPITAPLNYKKALIIWTKYTNIG